MRRALRFFLWGLIVVVALGGALFRYFVYSPAPEAPRLSGKLIKGTLEAGGWKRTYLTYVPQGLPEGAPLVVVMHGSGQNGAQMRRATGYGFERLADEHGFAVVYPDGYEGYWNGCNIVGDYSANKLNIDDVGFLTRMVDKLITEIGVDRGHVFAAGASRGGHMAFRLALEAPARFRAVAAVAANVPAPENFKCKPAGQGTSSVMIMNGTKDPLNPFEGGEVKLFGLFRRGKVRSSRESGQYFADLNHITVAPETKDIQVTGKDRVEQVLWRNGSKVEVELIAIHGGGHGMPQPYRRYPRIQGPTPKEPNGPAVIWAFFERQRPR
ncbi:MAG TPA: PHB depolymerase family esterase [Thermoanaerobaculia bacterium]|jgi:polyhydroxybutyrate depolymerase|nr:PHB depolymerase family esterase [Thermoanaerobaculia bacterium]